MTFRHFAVLLCGFAFLSTVLTLSAEDTIRIVDQPVVRNLDARQVVSNPRLVSEFTDEDVFALLIFEEPLVPLTDRKETPEERAAFAEMINAYTATLEARQPAESLLESFVGNYPESRWRPALEYNLGIIDYSEAYFTSALERYQSAYDLTKNDHGVKTKALSDAALAMRCEMLAKLGRRDDADLAIQQGLDRKPGGTTRQKFNDVQSAVEIMKRKEPGNAFKCGPFALASIRENFKMEPVYTPAIVDAKSDAKGFSFGRVAEIARQSGMTPQIVEVSSDKLSSLPVPSIVHWKLGHFAALVEKSADGSRFRVADKTFDFNAWVSVDALAKEGSGQYMIFVDDPIYAKVSQEVADATFGRGLSNGREDNQTKPSDVQCPGPPGECPMAAYSIHTMAVSLHVEDTPVSYQHHVGPSPNVKVFYNEVSTLAPANDNESNLGNQWSHNWHAYVKIGGTSNYAGDTATVILPGGGSESYILNSSGTGGSVWSNYNPGSRTKLIYAGSAGDTFRRELPNGWVERYNRVRYTSPNNYYYLTAVVDEAGNAVTVDYTIAKNRVDKITDELGEVTQFNYSGTIGDGYKIVSIDDPFGRETLFEYTTVGGNLQLASIQDPIQIKSRFTYNSTNQLLDKLITPSGTTSFVRSSSGALDRWIEATDPLGQTERVEYKNDMTSIGASVYTMPTDGGVVPSGFSSTIPHLYNSQHTFYWDKKQWASVVSWRNANGLTNGEVNYDYARAYRWLRTVAGGDILSSTLHSIKEPLEYRIWFAYAFQPDQNTIGTFDQPSTIARVVGGTTQVIQISRNNLGNPGVIVDPIGRKTAFTYESNDIDINQVDVYTSGTTFDTVTKIKWNSSGDHRPDWIRTASGTAGQTDFTWNARGQLTQKTNARGEVTDYTYSAGKLTEINPALPGVGDKIVITYDNAQRAKTRTQWAFTGSYGYNDVDRMTSLKYPDGTTDEWNYMRSGTIPTLDVQDYKDRLNRYTYFVYNGIRQVTSSTDTLGRVTKYEWCRCGALQKLTDPKGQVTDWVYDIQGRLIEKKIGGSTVLKNVYDPYRGLLASGTDALGQAKLYTYALDNRLSKIQYQNEVNTTPDVTFTWDAHYPRITSMVDGVPGTTTYAYGAIGGNSANLPETENLAGADKIIRYTYDKVGRLFRREIDSANFIEYYRDEIGRIKGTIATSGSVGYFYSATDGRITSVVNPNNGQTLNIDYMDNDPIKPPNLRELVTTSGSTVKAQLDYGAINAMGRIGKITSSVSSVWSSTFTYDNSDQLTRANTTGTMAPADNRYTYDVAANVEEWRQIISGVSTYYPYTKDSTNFTTAIRKGTTSGTGSPYLTFTKDANGNTTGWADAVSGKSETLKWDGENRLISVMQSPANKEFVMTYDGRNRLTIIEEKLSGVTQKTTRLVWSGLDLCEERDGSTNAVLTKYYPDGELQLIGGTWVPIWYYRDNLGSILETYSITGVRQSQRRFDEWGKVYGSVAGPGVSKKGFTGHYQPEGMDYVMAPYRWYSPAMRGWLSRDPIGESGGINLYSYAANNPENLIDPDGYCPLLLIPIIVTAPEWVPWAVLGLSAVISGGIIYDKYQDGQPTTYPSIPDINAQKGENDASNAPGKPTADDGFVEPKKPPGTKDGKVPNPNGQGRGYPDKSGDVWVPTGVGPLAHGGPHWDVQSPGGGHRNVYPGGRVR